MRVVQIGAAGGQAGLQLAQLAGRRGDLVQVPELFPQAMPLLQILMGQRVGQQIPQRRSGRRLRPGDKPLMQAAR